jgi:hypothetical protein
LQPIKESRRATDERSSGSRERHAIPHRCEDPAVASTATPQIRQIAVARNAIQRRTYWAMQQEYRCFDVCSSLPAQPAQAFTLT